MKQLLQNLRKGNLYLENVPVPNSHKEHLLVQTQCTLISAGTERMVVDFAKASLFQKAKQQPEKVKQVLEKMATDGIVTSMEAVLNKLDQPIPLGYSNVGHVIGIGKNVQGFKVGDRVLSNGRHAEVVSVPKNLCAKIPRNVSDSQAVFTVVGSIGLQGIRLLKPELGEHICVFGLGLIGLLSVQLLQAAGARVIAFDISSDRIQLANSFGIEAYDLKSGVNPVDASIQFSDGVGVDGVLITASTKSNDLIHQAAEMCRKRGRIILTGVTGLELRRSDFYEKELSFQVSCSYGPGRYDPNYEQLGQDYPIAFVRWTENRNFKTFLELLNKGVIKTEALISQKFGFSDSNQAYKALNECGNIGILLEYKTKINFELKTIDRPFVSGTRKSGIKGVVGIIGAGNFTQMRMLPNLKKSGAELKWIASNSGTSAAIAARRFDIRKITSEYRQMLEDPEVNAIFITTRHSSHAKIAIDALAAGKNVFVEKPLCVNRTELESIKKTLQNCIQSEVNPCIMVGFNRRFSSLSIEVAREIAQRSGPVSISINCNAGHIPGNHWTQGEEGGGRIIGEAIHFVDLIQFFANSKIVESIGISSRSEDGKVNQSDNASISLRMEDGSIGQINYFSAGANTYPKESIQIFVDGKVFTIDNFLTAKAYGSTRWKKKKLYRQDKGHKAAIDAFLDVILKGGEAPIAFSDLTNSHSAVFDALDFMNGSFKTQGRD
jgi:predicted dehydrogenase/threonine dehydrogenase-like Zn-dependent dehydrogenase